MAEVNEEIIIEWLHLCKRQFTIDNIPFKVYGEKGGSNYSNIDILAVDSKGNYYDYEIKWRSVFSLGATDKESIAGLLNQVTRKERKQQIRSIIGQKEYKKVFITTHKFFGKSIKKRNIFESKFRGKGIEVKYFEDMLSELIESVDVKGRYDSPTLQIIRMFKLFNLLKI